VKFFKRLPQLKRNFFKRNHCNELHQSGVKFKRPEKSSSLDIRFSNGILEIPQLKIFDQTEILFRNLQAFEQCHGRNAHTFINDYIYFISCVVAVLLMMWKYMLIMRIWQIYMLSRNQAVSDLFKSPNKENICSTNNFIWGVCEELIHIAESLGTSGINIL